MKKLLLLLSISVLSLQVKAQYVQSVIQSFEDKSNSDTTIQITSLSGDWQIGKPSKTLFNSAKMDMRAVMTDTSKPYTSNKLSQMVVLIKPKQYYNGLFINFWHQLNMKDGQDSAKIEFSLNQGKDWLNMSQIQKQVQCDPVFFNYDNAIDTAGVIRTSTKEWEQISFRIDVILLRMEETQACFDFFGRNFPNDIMMRFSFYSNGTNSTKEGWMIDDFRMQTTYRTGGIEKENKSISDLVNVVPNPSNGQLTRLETLSQNIKINTWQLLDMQGIVKSSSNNSNEIETKTLPNGLYTIKINTSAGLVIKKLILN